MAVESMDTGPQVDEPMETRTNRVDCVAVSYCSIMDMDPMMNGETDVESWYHNLKTQIRNRCGHST